MVKQRVFEIDPHHDDSDTFDELQDDVDMKSPKKAKKETNFDGCESPYSKRKRASNPGRAWTKEEEEALLDLLQEVIVAGMTQTFKNYPQLASRKTIGCLNHWHSWRRKLEISLFGASTIDHNGKKLIKMDASMKDPNQFK
ncbi:uncharacterized protein UTRI_06536 [Ustilago trichophora]|uniref:Myb-like domain-containing protein n=1 Tax=Ustilago trichophora TaxID=86804 RepID=A0A5C3ENX0_9BASI|nr:uncharacterized protein UTRI_06536 [Ustilago trichophora]